MTLFNPAKPREETWEEYQARKKAEARERGWYEKAVPDPEWDGLTPEQQIRRALEDYAKRPGVFRAEDGNFYPEAGR